MPLVRIDTSDEWADSEVRLIGDAVFKTLQEVFSVPDGDKFQVISRHALCDLNIASSFHGMEYSNQILLIQITLNEGRGPELKKVFYKTLVQDIQSVVNVRSEDVIVNLVEVCKENWSFGNGLAQLA